VCFYEKMMGLDVGYKCALEPNEFNQPHTQRPTPNAYRRLANALMNHECVFIRENVSKMLSYRQTLERAYAVPAPIVALPPMLERSYAVPAPIVALPPMLERSYAVPAPLTMASVCLLERAYAVPAPLTDADIAAIITPPRTMTMERAYAVPAPLTDADIGLLTTLPALPSFSAWVKDDE
jgi:hypothetical protein